MVNMKLQAQRGLISIISLICCSGFEFRFTFEGQWEQVVYTYIKTTSLVVPNSSNSTSQAHKLTLYLSYYFDLHIIQGAQLSTNSILYFWSCNFLDQLFIYGAGIKVVSSSAYKQTSISTNVELLLQGKRKRCVDDQIWWMIKLQDGTWLWPVCVVYFYLAFFRSGFCFHV